jgi:hypothetical protein
MAQFQRGMSVKASQEAIDKGNKRAKELQAFLSKHLIQRKKTLLAAENAGLLKGKNDFVVLCDLTPLQVRFQCW